MVLSRMLILKSVLVNSLPLRGTHGLQMTSLSSARTSPTTAGNVAAIDIQLANPPALSFEIGFENGRRLFLRTIGRCHGASQNQLCVEVCGDVPLIAVESLALALSPVAH